MASQSTRVGEVLRINMYSHFPKRAFMDGKCINTEKLGVGREEDMGQGKEEKAYWGKKEAK